MLRRPTEEAVRACFLQGEERWIAWSDDVPGALIQGKTLDEAGENLKDAIRLMLEPVDEAKLPEPAGRLVEELIVF
jgi:predicted RNase H-like HicB family nuclease